MIAPQPEPSPSAILILEDPEDRDLVSSILRERGFEILDARTIEDADRELEEEWPELIVLPLRVACNEGFELIRKLHDTDTQVVFLQDSLPEQLEDLESMVCGFLGKAMDVRGFERLISDLSPEACQAPAAGLDLLVGTSNAMCVLYDRIRKVSPSDETVLLVGESGTGKELVANAVHRMSKRSDGPFVPVNCGAMTAHLAESLLFGHERGSFTGATRRHEGYFEQAHGGTIFLDEVTEMALDHQVRLLRVLETSKLQRLGSTEQIAVDVRVVAATNRDPEVAVKEGRLRSDLFYRLHVFPIVIPPLRLRDGEDIELLAREFLDDLCDHYERSATLSSSAIAKLKDYDWPGNVRELRNVIRRAFVLSTNGRIEARDIETGASVAPPVNGERAGQEVVAKVGTSLARMEKELILATLDRCAGDKRKAARILGISPRTLYYRLDRYRDEDGAPRESAVAAE